MIRVNTTDRIMAISKPRASGDDPGDPVIAAGRVE